MKPFDIYFHLLGYCVGGVFGSLIFYQVVGPAFDLADTFWRSVLYLITVLFWAKVGEQIDALGQHKEGEIPESTFVAYSIGFFAGDGLFRAFLETPFRLAHTNIAITTLAYWIVLVGTGKLLDWSIAYSIACNRLKGKASANSAEKIIQPPSQANDATND